MYFIGVFRGRSGPRFAAVGTAVASGLTHLIRFGLPPLWEFMIFKVICYSLRKARCCIATEPSARPVDTSKHLIEIHVKASIQTGQEWYYEYVFFYDTHFRLARADSRLNDASLCIPNVRTPYPNAPIRIYPYSGIPQWTGRGLPIGGPTHA